MKFHIRFDNINIAVADDNNCTFLEYTADNYTLYCDLDELVKNIAQLSTRVASAIESGPAPSALNS